MKRFILLGLLVLLGSAAFGGENTSIYPGTRRGVIYQVKSTPDTADLTSSDYPVVQCNQKQTVTLSLTFNAPATTSKIVLIRHYVDSAGAYHPESTSSYTVTAQSWQINGRYCGNAIDFDTAAYSGFSVAVASISSGNVSVAWSIR